MNTNVSTAAALQPQIELQTRLYNNALDEINDMESNTRPNEHINNAKWIAGHVLHMRLTHMSRITGLPMNDTYAQFDRGTALDMSANYPSIEQMKADWNQVSPQILERVTSIPEEALNSEVPPAAPIQDKTLRGLFAFVVAHEALHIGQLSLIRKMLGKEAITFK